jgi:tRNA threonylcarbamoyladenosine biosynthesis protein TsaE
VVTHVSDSPQRTQAIAAELASKLRSGDCIALDGQLGAGKTQFVRGLVGALGGDISQVSSPTYVLLNIYSTPRLTIYHLDAYRVGGADDLEAIGFSELLEQGGIVIVEWAERVRGLLPENCLRIQIDVIGEHSREIHIHI